MIEDKNIVYFTARIRSVAENVRDLSILISKFQNEWQNIDTTLPDNEEINENRSDYISNVTSTELQNLLTLLQTLKLTIDNDSSNTEKFCVRSPLSLE